MTNSTITWIGASGRQYQYWIIPLKPNFPIFKVLGGNYIFTKETRPGCFTPLYIGETGDLSERFDTHHKMRSIILHGATHIHQHTNPDHQARLAEERDLIAKWKPICNG